MAKDKRSSKDVLLDVKRITADIKARKFKPLYVLHGEEPYYIDLLTALLTENVLEESERDFNQTILYANDTKPEDVPPLARQYPVMAPYQVVMVKEAQQWRSLDGLMPLVNHPVATSVVVLTFKGKTVDKRTGFYKAADKIGEVFQSDKLADWEVVTWIHEYCKSQKIAIEDRAVAQLADNIGNHLHNLINALDKLEVVCKKNGTITESAVLENIGISKDFNVFELNKAIGLRHNARALLIANYFANNEKEHHIIPTMAMVYRHFRLLAIFHDYPDKNDNAGLTRAMGLWGANALREYRDAAGRYPMHSVVEVLQVLHDIDLKSKGVGNSSAGSGDLMREMVARVLRC